MIQAENASCMHIEWDGDGNKADGDGGDDDNDVGLADVPVLLLHCSHRGKILHGISTGLFHGVSSSTNSKDSLGSNSPRFVQRRLWLYKFYRQEFEKTLFIFLISDNRICHLDVYDYLKNLYRFPKGEILMALRSLP